MPMVLAILLSIAFSAAAMMARAGLDAQCSTTAPIRYSI